MDHQDQKVAKLQRYLWLIAVGKVEDGETKGAGGTAVT